MPDNNQNPNQVDSNKPTQAIPDDDENTTEVEQVENSSLDAMPSHTDIIGGNDLDKNITAAESNEQSKTPKTDQTIKSKLSGSIFTSIKHLDVYMIVFFVVIFLAVAAVIYGVEKNKTPPAKNTVNTPLSQSALTQLNNNDTQIGSSGQILTVQSNAVFNNSALIKGNLQIAGTVEFGGSLTIPGLDVSGNTKMQDVSENNLNLAGSESVAGPLTVDQGLTVDGNTSFNSPISASQLTVSTLDVNGNINITHHLVTNGSIPLDSTDSNIGSGGTSTVNGDDTAGQVVINTGTNASAGCMATITFSKSFSTPPNVVITQVQAGSGVPPSNPYYITRSTTSFSICSQDPPVSANIAFDYIVID